MFEPEKEMNIRDLILCILTAFGAMGFSGVPDLIGSERKPALVEMKLLYTWKPG